VASGIRLALRNTDIHALNTVDFEDPKQFFYMVHILMNNIVITSADGISTNNRVNYDSIDKQRQFASDVVKEHGQLHLAKQSVS